MAAERTVIFDLGNVLIEWNLRNLYSTLISEPGELDYFLNNILTADVNDELDRGKPIHDVARGVVERYPAYSELVMAYAEQWHKTLGPVIDGTVEILQELKQANIPLLALSNWGQDTFASIEANYWFFSLFDGMVISGREGVTKPDRAIFDLLCDRYGLRPQDAVFIDDSPANIGAATELGFDAVLFDSPELLRQQLTDRDLLLPNGAT